LGLLGWIQIDQIDKEHSFKTEAMVAVESKVPNLVKKGTLNWEQGTGIVLEVLEGDLNPPYTPTPNLNPSFYG
jgi:hypothetical protein